MIHNFRPGVMERIGLGAEAVRAINPGIVVAVVSGYGTTGMWRDKPGQDLLAQSRAGLVWLSGSDGDPPIPIGISVTDITAGAHLVQGILAALLRRVRTGEGGLVEVSLLSSAMDLQFEQFTTYLNDGRVLPHRSAVSGANVHAAAPYGIYKTANGFLAIAMTPIAKLADLLGIAELETFPDPSIAFERRDEIKAILRDALVSRDTAHWLSLLEPADIWCAEVLDWQALEAAGALDDLEVVQTVNTTDGTPILTTTCPIRLDGQILRGRGAAPVLGQDTEGLLRALPDSERSKTS